MTNRLIPAFVVTAVIFMLMYRGVGMASSDAPTAENSSAVGVVDGVFEGGAQAASIGIPSGALVAGVALILVGALVVSR